MIKNSKLKTKISKLSKQGYALKRSFLRENIVSVKQGFTLIRTRLRQNLVNVQGFTLIKTSLPENFVRAKQGFTLIELLVVIMIIGVLVGISLFALTGARESARDGRRKADLEAIRSALELYKADCNAYVSASGNVGSALDTDASGTRLVGSGASSSCPTTNVYLEKIPNDILSGRNYYYSSAGTTYEVCARLESPPTSPDTCGGGANNCGTSNTCNYRVTNP